MIDRLGSRRRASRPRTEGAPGKAGGLTGSRIFLVAVAASWLVAGPAYPAGDFDCQQQLVTPQRPPTVVTFAADSARLAPEDTARLGKLVRGDLNGNDEIVCVYAQAEAQGDPGYNLEIAERRAGVVASAIREAGLERRRMIVVVQPSRAVSASEPAVAVGFALDRRVQVLRLAGQRGE